MSATRPAELESPQPCRDYAIFDQMSSRSAGRVRPVIEGPNRIRPPELRRRTQEGFPISRTRLGALHRRPSRDPQGHLERRLEHERFQGRWVRDRGNERGLSAYRARDCTRSMFVHVGAARVPSGRAESRTTVGAGFELEVSDIISRRIDRRCGVTRKRARRRGERGPPRETRRNASVVTRGAQRCGARIPGGRGCARKSLHVRFARDATLGTMPLRDEAAMGDAVRGIRRSLRSCVLLDLRGGSAGGALLRRGRELRRHHADGLQRDGGMQLGHEVHPEGSLRVLGTRQVRLDRSARRVPVAPTCQEMLTRERAGVCGNERGHVHGDSLLRLGTGLHRQPGTV
jgi:hypothetical protein